MGSLWNTRDTPYDPESPLRVHLLCSRNKDNAHIEGFKERRCSFVARDCDVESVERKFERFVVEGRTGEMCRWYSSLNPRDPDKVCRRLIHRLVDGNVDIAHLQGDVAGIAARAECAAEKRWFFDFDDPNAGTLAEFKADLWHAGGFLANGETNLIEVRKTPHGFAVVVPHGFDTRELLDPETGWGDKATLKRDDLLIRAWDTNAYAND